MDKITSFTGRFRFLSNFTYAYVIYEGDAYGSVEHAYQAAKFPKEKRAIFMLGTALTAGQAKRLGQKASLSPDWEIKKVEVMRELIVQKFKLRSYSGKLLMEIGQVELVEGNSWGDTFWGQCKGKGKNMPGILLMQRRAQLFKEQESVNGNVIF